MLNQYLNLNFLLSSSVMLAKIQIFTLQAYNLDLLRIIYLFQENSLLVFVNQL